VGRGDGADGHRDTAVYGRVRSPPGVASKRVRVLRELRRARTLFSWQSRNLSNFRKHGIWFEEAQTMLVGWPCDGVSRSGTQRRRRAIPPSRVFHPRENPARRFLREAWWECRQNHLGEKSYLMKENKPHRAGCSVASKREPTDGVGHPPVALGQNAVILEALYVRAALPASAPAARWLLLPCRGRCPAAWR
jgi:hypothetical protein